MYIYESHNKWDKMRIKNNNNIKVNKSETERNIIIHVRKCKKQN